MSIDQWEEQANQKPVSFAIKFLISAVFILFVVGAVMWGLGWFSEAGQVAKEEFGARAALKKYEWFVDQSNRIKKMDEDIKLFENRRNGVESKYKTYGKEPAKWPPDVRVSYNREISQAKDDLTAIASQRNSLVQEYNAASEKFNWAPFNTRDDKPAPEFTIYQLE